MLLNENYELFDEQLSTGVSPHPLYAVTCYLVEELGSIDETALEQQFQYQLQEVSLDVPVGRSHGC